MSRSGRKRVSKWDKKEEHLGGTQFGIWPRKVGESFDNNESQPKRHSAQLAGGIDSEYYGGESKNNGGPEFSDVMLAWNRDGNYSTRMSPGLEDWRQQKLSHSPRAGQGRSYRSLSRSRSRSPSHGFERKSGLHGRSNAAQTCRDFAAGRCRRGDRCPYLHPGDQKYEDRRCSDDRLTNNWKSRQRMDGASKYSTSDDSREYLQSLGRSNDLCSDFIKGKCYKGASCEFAHIEVGSNKESAKEGFRERENDRSKYAFFQHSRDNEPHRSGDIPCIYFAAGNCRKGKFCRFSHHAQTANPNDRPHDDWRRQSGNLDSLEHTEEHLRRSAAVVSDFPNLLEHEDKNGTYSRDDRWVGTFNIDNRSFGHPTNNGKSLDCNEREYLPPKEDTTADSGGFEVNSAENWFADMEISSPWNPGQSSGHVVKEESGKTSETTQSISLNVPSLQTYEQCITGEMLDQKNQVTAAMPPLISENAYFQSKPSSAEDAGSYFSLKVRKETSDCPTIGPQFSANVLREQSFDQIGHNSTAATHGFSRFSAVGQNQTFPLHGPGGESITTAQNSRPDVGDGNKSGFTSGIPPTQNNVSLEQLSQLANLSALSQLFGHVQQLSHLGAVPNLQKSMEIVSSVLSNSAGLVNPLAPASTHPNPITGSERLYDPLSDSIELVQHHNDNPPLGILPNPIEEKVVSSNKPELSSRDLLSSLTGGPSGSNQYKTSNSDVKLDLLSPVANCHGEGNNGKSVEESNKPQENGALEKMNEDGKADEGKKKNDGKGIRAFKFALAEFVKEIMKPKWQEGLVNRESYKAIVKKVVDKVTGSIQAAHIPQSQEKIDHYLSSSKPKVTKLIEAYVEKHQKTTET